MSIHCKGVGKSFGKVQAVREIDLHCIPGEVVGILGANGAGKTTLFKLIMGLLRPDYGTIECIGKGEKKIGGIIEKPSLYSYLSAKENLLVFAKMQGCRHDSAFLEESLQQVGLPLDRTDPIRNFSMGMKQRLGIAIALLNNPASLVLDEPFSGLDPLGIEALQKLIRELAQTQNLTILISSHLVDLLAQTCDVLHVMQQGELVYGGNPSALLAKYTKAYHICGTNIETAQALRAYSYTLQGHCATVSVHATAISNLLAQLTQEGININSCTPQLDLHQLFNPAV